MLEKLKAVSGQVWQWLKPIVIILLTQAGKQAMVAALAIVKELATRSDLNNAQKRELAQHQIQQAGVQMGESALNLVIEMAVQSLKANGVKTP